MIKFTVKGCPVVKEGSSVTRYGNYDSQELINYKKLVQDSFRKEVGGMFEPISSEIYIMISIFLPENSCLKIIAVSNTIAESLERIAYVNMSQIVKVLEMEKTFSDNPRVIIVIKKKQDEE
jgi:hypothetical protein